MRKINTNKETPQAQKPLQSINLEAGNTKPAKQTRQSDSYTTTNEAYVPVIYNISLSLSRSQHAHYIRHYDSKAYKPAKQTRQMVIRFCEHQVIGFHLISTLELFILFPLCGSFDKSKLAPFILSS